MPLNPHDLHAKEKEFLHAIASPLSGMELILESVLEDLPVLTKSEDIRERLEEINSAISKINKLMIERRNEVTK